MLACTILLSYTFAYIETFERSEGKAPQLSVNLELQRVWSNLAMNIYFSLALQPNTFTKLLCERLQPKAHPLHGSFPRLLPKNVWPGQLHCKFTPLGKI